MAAFGETPVPEPSASKPEAIARAQTIATAEVARSLFSPLVLNLGFVFALLLSAVCLAFAALYLNTYLNVTSSAVTSVIHDTAGEPLAMQFGLAARLAVAKFSLSSCGVVAGLAFGFLGFALFLLGVHGSMDVKANGAGNSLELARVAPGTLVLVCAAILVGVSITHPIDFNVNQSNEPAATLPPANAPPGPEAGHASIP